MPAFVSSASRSAVALATVAALASTGCAGLFGPGPDASFAAVDLDAPGMRQFPVASTTDLERDVRIETSGDKQRSEKLTPALFWTGIILGTVGAAGAIGFGAAGHATKVKLNNGYTGDGLTLDERDKLVSQGQAFDGTTIAFTTAAVLGYALAIVTYGVDWNRCGPLVDKRRNCKALGLADDP